jgi:hypothetical protein
LLTQFYVRNTLVKKLFHKVSKKKKESVSLLVLLYYTLINLFIILVYGSENKQILTKRSIIFLKKFLKRIFKKFLKLLGKEPNIDLNKLSINEWKFKLKSEISLLEIVTVKNDNNNINNEAVDVDIENISKEERNIEIFFFNAESDVIIQTNYPLPNVFEKGKNYQSIIIYYY